MVPLVIDDVWFIPFGSNGVACLGLVLGFFQGFKTLGDGFSLDCRQDDMIAVHDDDRARAPTVGGVHKMMVFPGFVL